MKLIKLYISPNVMAETELLLSQKKKKKKL